MPDSRTIYRTDDGYRRVSFFNIGIYAARSLHKSLRCWRYIQIDCKFVT
jgi:hypothetical protein